ncbi:unnamed protein product [Mesocestoides corti]|uniref:Ovule protein n=1 Tax=Mesocestoides corti TaxID=53468 RepID=A0A0R3UKU5_MESCO|nr:unnamed protein product [Mesocestoides corti]
MSDFYTISKLNWSYLRSEVGEWAVSSPSYWCFQCQMRSFHVVVVRELTRDSLQLNSPNSGFLITSQVSSATTFSRLDPLGCVNTASMDLD